jgi:hypothetical protein
MYANRLSTVKPLTLTQKMSPLLLAPAFSPSLSSFPSVSHRANRVNPVEPRKLPDFPHFPLNKKNPPQEIPLRLRALAPLHFMPLLPQKPHAIPTSHSPTPQNPPPFPTFQSQPQKPSAISTLRFRNLSLRDQCPPPPSVSRLHAFQQPAARKRPKKPRHFQVSVINTPNPRPFQLFRLRSALFRQKFLLARLCALSVLHALCVTSSRGPSTHRARTAKLAPTPAPH